MFAIAAYTGLRAGEILGLRREDIDLEAKTIRVTQTAWYGEIQTAKTRGSESTVPLPGVLCQLAQGHLSSEGLLFVNQRGRPHTGEKIVRLRLRPILDRLGIPRAGFHAFRHMHTALLLEGGASPKVTQRQLRHSDARTTLEIYGHVVEDAHRNAVERAAAYLN